MVKTIDDDELIEITGKYVVDVMSKRLSGDSVCTVVNGEVDNLVYGAVIVAMPDLYAEEITEILDTLHSSLKRAVTAADDLYTDDALEKPTT